MKRTGPFLLTSLLLVGSASTAMAGAYGEEGVTTETPAATTAPPPAAETVEEETVFARPGGYIQVGGVYTIQNFSSHADIGGFALDDADDTGGYEIRVGYHINKMFALEIEWEHYLHYGNVAPSANLDQWAMTMNGKFYPIGGRFQPYALVGIGASKAELEAPLPIGKEDDVGFAARFGVGLDIYLTENIGMALEAGYLMPTGDAAQFDNIPLSGSFFYRFG